MYVAIFYSLSLSISRFSVFIYSIYVCLSIYLSIYLSICLFILPSLSISHFLAVSLPLRLFSISLSFSLFISHFHPMCLSTSKSPLLFISFRIFLFSISVSLPPFYCYSCYSNKLYLSQTLFLILTHFPVSLLLLFLPFFLFHSPPLPLFLSLVLSLYLLLKQNNLLSKFWYAHTLSLFSYPFPFSNVLIPIPLKNCQQIH